MQTLLWPSDRPNESIWTVFCELGTSNVRFSVHGKMLTMSNVLAPPILLTLNLILICCCRRWRKELRKRKLLLGAQLVSGTGEHRDKPSNFHIAYVVSGSLQTTACTKAVHSHGVAPTFYAPPLGCCTTVIFAAYSSYLVPLSTVVL